MKQYYEIETRRMLLKTMEADVEFKESLAKSDQAEADAETNGYKRN